MSHGSIYAIIRGLFRQCGKEKNKYWDKKLNAGRGPVGKAAVVGIKDRATNKVVAVPMEGVTQASVTSMIDGAVDDDAMVYTDDSSAYSRLEKAQERHGPQV